MPNRSAKQNPKPWEKRHKGRTYGVRNRRRVLILCEDTKSSVYYFKGFRIDETRIQIITIGTGKNTDSLVEHALKLKNAADNQKNPFSLIWCVFDRDEFPAHNFNRAFQLAENNGIEIAWANEAFELWYLLHFNFHDTSISRHDYARRLKGCLECAYDKADNGIYDKLLEHQSRAIQHARKLEKHWIEQGGCIPENANPSTNVHKLVELLNQLKELGPADGD